VKLPHALASLILSTWNLVQSAEEHAKVQPSSVIKPPLGLAWGEKNSQLEKLLTNAKAHIAQRRNDGEFEIWRVTGLTQNGLKETVFTFRLGKLCKVTLRYADQSWDADSYRNFEQQIEARIVKRYGSPAETELGDQSRFERWRKGTESLKLIVEAPGDAQTISIEYATEREF